MNRQPKQRYEFMADYPVDLDKHRGRAARTATEFRRQRLRALQADQATLRRSQEELKIRLLGATSETWPEAVAKAQYLIDLFAATPRARDLRRSEFITHALDDLTRLCDRTKEHS